MKAYGFAATALLAATGLQGCAAVFDGTSQSIMVSTNPPGASCSFERKGATVGMISSTPLSITVKKTKDDITIRCNKEGYEETTYLNHSGVAGATYADVVGGVLTGGIAWGIDSASGADNKYDGTVNITLLPKGSKQAAADPAK
ncbi:MAG TPA: hypothetical protein VG798_03725 [Rhizomicrobium sp.]|nr:hypothetical protein [Rhizomicrobium sp.]